MDDQDKKSKPVARPLDEPQEKTSTSWSDLLPGFLKGMRHTTEKYEEDNEKGEFYYENEKLEFEKRRFLNKIGQGSDYKRWI